VVSAQSFQSDWLVAKVFPDLVFMIVSSISNPATFVHCEVDDASGWCKYRSVPQSLLFQLEGSSDGVEAVLAFFDGRGLELVLIFLVGAIGCQISECSYVMLFVCFPSRK